MFATFFGVNMNEYVHGTGIVKSGIWASEVEVLATASFLGVDIMVHGEYGKCKKWLLYPASLNLNDLNTHALFLSHEENHFNVVTST